MTTANTASRTTDEAQGHQAIIACEKCGYEWTTRSEVDRVICPNCQHKTKRSVVKFRWTERAKLKCDRVTAIEEMTERHEQQASQLRTLSDEGWVLEDVAIRDDYAQPTHDLMEVGEDGD